jgi:hypothetical protein
MTIRVRVSFAMLATVGLLLSGVIPAFAGPVGEEVPSCTGENVEGTLVSVDQELGVAVINTADGLCTLTLESEFDHPIVGLFQEQWGNNAAAEDLSDLLQGSQEATQVWLVYDETTDDWNLAAEGDEGAISGQVTGVVDNGDGTYSLEIGVEGQDDPLLILTDDAELASSLQASLEDLFVAFDVFTDEEGNAVLGDVGAQVAAYHEEGMGFGVLVKLYSMAENLNSACGEPEEGEGEEGGEGEEPPAEGEETEEEACGVSVEELVAEFQSGKGMGQLFKEYGRPGMMGIGHLRKAVKEGQTAGEEDDLSETEAVTVEGKGNNGKGNGNGNGNKGGNGNGGGNGKGKGPKNK